MNEDKNELFDDRAHKAFLEFAIGNPDRDTLTEFGWFQAGWAAQRRAYESVGPGTPPEHPPEHEEAKA